MRIILVFNRFDIMKIVEIFIDSIGYLIIKIKELLAFLLGLVFDLFLKLYEKFLEISLSEKIVFLNTVPAFFAIILPVARYYIFEMYFYKNNPLAVYMIGITFIMFSSIYFSGLVKLVIRLLVNAYYLFWIIYLPLAEELTKADPYEICFGYYLNVAVPFIYLITSLLSYFLFSDEGR